MTAMKHRVLYISNEDRSIGGSSLSLKAMLEALGDAVEPLILFREEGTACAFFRDAGYKCIVIPFNRGTFNHSGLARIVRFVPHAVCDAFIRARCVRRVCSEAGGFDLVHSNSGTVDIGLSIARRARVPHIWHIREYLDLGLGQRPFPGWKSWKRKLRSSGLVIAISPGLLAHLNPGPNGVCLPDAVCHSGDAVLVWKKKPCVLFVAGTVSSPKRPDEAVRIFAGAGLDGYCLKIVGNTPPDMKEKLTRLAEECGAGDSLVFIPFSANVPDMLSEASALLVCTEYEGMGRVAIEAMFHGCPVVARGSGGSLDVLEGGTLGHLYTSIEEASEMLAEVCRFLPEEQLKKAREAAIRHYSIENYGKEILELYHRLI